MIKKRIHNIGIKKNNSVKIWQNKLLNMPCFILGNSPSLNDEPIHLLEPYFTIGVNRIFYKIDPTILLWQDVELFYTERRTIPKLQAIKYCRDVADPINGYYHFVIMGNEYKIPKNPMVLHGHGSSGPLAFQLAYLIGCDPIILLGYDCCYRGKQTDFYGENKYHSKYTLDNCRIGLKWIKENGTKRTIINCSDTSMFAKKEKLKDVINKVKHLYPETGRSFFTNKLFLRP